MSDVIDWPSSEADSPFRPHTSHWGVFSARWSKGRLEVRPHAGDPDPNRIIENFPGALRHRARVAQPMVRRGWLERGPGPDDTRGPGAVFCGSYGWASAGRFHHAQSQVHRFLNTALGGYGKSVNSYRSGAASVIVPHVLGDYVGLTMHNVSWEQVAEHTDIVVAFGGMALKNSMVAGGSVSKHVERG